jgi:hypothetical protein
MQRYLAVTTIGPSALRNQGSGGVIKAARNYLAAVDLGAFRTKDEPAFLNALDASTEALKRAFPKGARHWGAARKACNLFLRDICYNRFLCQRYGLDEAEEWMEIPLDSIIAIALKRKSQRGGLPRWPGLNRLTAEVSAEFQAFAAEVAVEQGISRVHLDMRLWTIGRERNGGHSPQQARGALNSRN